jgi:hypothetical protein
MEQARALGDAQHWLVKGDGITAGGGQQIYFVDAPQIIEALAHGGHVTNYAGSVKVPVPACGAVEPVTYHKHAQCLFTEQFLMEVGCRLRPFFPLN